MRNSTAIALVVFAGLGHFRLSSGIGYWVKQYAAYRASCGQGLGFGRALGGFLVDRLGSPSINWAVLLCCCQEQEQAHHFVI